MSPVFGLEWWQFCLYIFLAGFCWHLGVWGVTLLRRGK